MKNICMLPEESEGPKQSGRMPFTAEAERRDDFLRRKKTVRMPFLRPKKTVRMISGTEENRDLTVQINRFCSSL